MHDDDDFDAGPDFDEEDASVEAKVWQLLLLINPGDEETALQQFADYREAAEDDGDEPLELVARVIDWRSGFNVGADDLRALVQAIDELVARWNLSIDWGGDPDDDDFFDEADAAGLLAIAHDHLAESGYTLWLREADDDRLTGWMTLARDNEPMRELATALHINLRLGSDAG